MNFKKFSIIEKIKSNKKVASIINNRHFQIGVPFVTIILFSFYLVRESQSVRFEFRNVKTITRKEWEARGVRLKDKPYSLEEDYERIKDKDFNDWENKRIPRPPGWE